MANQERYYKYPFAESGDRADVPDDSSAGEVSFYTGYGSDYGLDAGAPTRRRIERPEYNQVLNGITGNIKRWQESVYPTWIEDTGDGNHFSYGLNAIVSHAGVDWISNSNSTSGEPGIDDDWRKISLSQFVNPSVATIIGAGDLIRVKSSDDELAISLGNILGKLYPVGGQPLFLLSSITPNQLGYPGAWQVAESDCSINTVARTSSSAGTISGNNSKSVPVPFHNHNATFTGRAMPDHDHDASCLSNTHYHVQGGGVDAARAGRYGREDTGLQAVRDDDLSSTATHGRRTSSYTHDHDIDVKLKSAGTPSGSVAVNSAGTSGATINVQGRAANVVMWIRTS